LGDGLFHLFVWILNVIGISLLWRAGRRANTVLSGQLFTGSLLLGAGLFNLVEGTINHQILGIHHLKPGIHQGLWDIGFLASGVLLIGVGLLLIQQVKARKAV
jgi:uncharacterized membrane protein